MFYTAEDKQKLIDKLKRHLGVKQFYTVKEIVQLGLYGCKSTVHRAIHLKELPFIHLTGRRLVIMREDLLKILASNYNIDYLQDHDKEKTISTNGRKKT